MREGLDLRRLGKSDLMVSPIGLGCWQFSKGKGFVGKFWPVLSDDQIRETVDISLKGGVNWFDTAEVYGWGESEKALNRALKSLGTQPKDIVIATKWFPLFKMARSITQTINERLRALDVPCIDLHQIHFPGSLSSTRSTMKAMAKLVKKGKIRYVGVSNYSAKQMRRAYEELSRFGLSLVSNQMEYSLLKRKIERNGVLDTAKELDITIIAYSPLAQGILSGKFHDNPQSVQSEAGFRKRKALFRPEGLNKSRPVIDALKELAAKYEATPAQIALNWVTHFHGNMVVAIPGATKVKQAEDNASSMRFRLSKDELDHLGRISKGF